MPVLSEGLVPGDWLKGEIETPQMLSRDQVLLTNGTGSAVTIVTGTVIGKITSSGKWVQYAPGASDGSQNAAGILIPSTIIPANSDVASVAITRDAVVSDINITWPTQNGTQLNTAIAALAALQIIIRRTA